MATTKLAPKFDSGEKNVPSRRPNIANNFSNWNKLLNNVNVVVKNTKKISEKVEIKEKIIDKYSLVDTNLININKQIEDKKKEEKKGFSNWLAMLTGAAADGKDDKANKRLQNIILQNIEKNDLDRSLEYLRKQYRYYRYLQHQEIVYVEKMRLQKINEKKSWSGYLRSIGPPIFITATLAGAVIGINLLFITNISGMSFWIALCEKMVNSKFNKVIFEATINVMASFGLFTNNEVVTLRKLYSEMMVKISSSDFKNTGTNIPELARKVFSSKEKYEKPDSTKEVINFFEYIKSSLESKNIYNAQSKTTIKDISELKDKVFKSASSTVPTTDESKTNLLPSNIGLDFVTFVFNNYNSPVFKWSFSMLGISFNLFKFVNVSINKLISHPNSNSIIIFKELTTNILNSYTGNQLITFISSTVSDIPGFVSEQITTSNIEYFLSPMKEAVNKIGPVGTSAKEYISPTISPLISNVGEIVGEINSYITSYLSSFINYTQKEIEGQIIKLTLEEIKTKKDIDDDKNTIKIFTTKLNKVLEEYNNLSSCLLKNPKDIGEIKICYNKFINFMISLYQTQKGTNLAPKILVNTLKTINEQTTIESMKTEIDKVFNYYSGVFVSENADKLSGINNRLIQNNEILSTTTQKINDLKRKIIDQQITETYNEIKSIKLIKETDRNNESPEKIKQKFKKEFNYEELNKKINDFRKCFDKKTADEIKSCYKVLTEYIINSANAETPSPSDVEKSFVQKLKEKMIDVDKITDITQLKEEGNSIIYSTNSYFFYPLIELMSESIISKKKIFDRIGKTENEIKKLNEKEFKDELKREILFRQSQKKIQQQQQRLENNIYKKKFLKKKISLEQEAKKGEIITTVDEIIGIIGKVSEDVNKEIISNEDLITKLKDLPFDEFKKYIVTELTTFNDGIISNSESYKGILLQFIDKYSSQITELSDKNLISGEEKNNLESIVKKIKKYSDRILDTKINIKDEEFFEISNYIDEYNGNLNLILNKSLKNIEISETIDNNTNDYSNFSGIISSLINNINKLDDYTVVNDIIQKGVNEDEIIKSIQTKLSDNINNEFNMYTEIVEDIEEGITTLLSNKKIATEEIINVENILTTLRTKKIKIKETIDEIKANKAQILSLKYVGNTFSPEEIEKLDKIRNLEKINKGLSDELLKITESIKETTAKFNKPLVDIKSELKKIKLESGILDATIKDKDTSFLGQFSSDGFFKGLVKSNVNMYLHTNKNKMVDLFFDKFTDENEAKAYKEKITAVKKNQISLIEEEVLYMSKIGKGRTTKEIKNILYSSKIAVNNNPLNFRSPITKFVATLYSTFGSFLNDPTTIMYASFSSSFLQNIFTKSFMATFFGGLGGGIMIQHSVLKDTFYTKFELKDNWVKNIAYNWLGLGEISDFILEKMFGSEISFRSLLVSILTLIIGNDTLLNMRIQTFLNNLVQDIIYDFDILFTRLSSILFYSKSVQSIYGYVESILGVWLTGSFKISAKISYKLLLLPSISNNLKNKIPKKIELIKLINDQKKFGSLCQFINYKMYNIVNYAKKLKISDIFMQFTNLKDTIFLENVNTFLDTDYFFQIQKYDPTKSISNLNGNIISLTDKLTSNIEEYIIVDNDPDNFKLIQTSELKTFIKNKLKDIETPDIDLGGIKDSVMEYLLLYYVNKFKEENKVEFDKLNNQYKNESEYNEKFEIPFNDFLVKEASQLYKNGNPDLIEYSLVSRLITLLADNKEHNKKIIVDNKKILESNEELPEKDKKQLRQDFYYLYWNAKTSVIDPNIFPSDYMKKFHNVITNTKISSKKEDEEDEKESEKTETNEFISPEETPKKAEEKESPKVEEAPKVEEKVEEAPKVEEKAKELTPDDLIKTMPIKELFDSQSVKDIVLFVPYYDIFLGKISYNKKYVNFRDYLKISQQLLFSMNDENNIQITKDQIERLEALQEKTKDSYLTEALTSLNSKFTENFNDLKNVRVNFENTFSNALQKGYIEFSSLGLDNEFFLQNLLNFNLADSKGYEGNKEILNKNAEILKIELEFTELNSQLDSLAYRKTQLEESKTITPEINVEIQELTSQITEKNLKITEKNAEINNKKKILTGLKEKYIEQTLFGKLLPNQEMTEEKKNMKQYICFITGKISQLIDKCETSNEELVKFMLKPENLLTINDPDHAKNKKLTSRIVSDNINYQKEKTKNQLQAIQAFQIDYTNIITEIDTEMVDLSNFLKETIQDPACNPPNNKTKTVQEFIYLFQLSNFKEQSKVTMNDNDLCEVFKEKFGQLTTKLESLDSKIKELEDKKSSFISRISTENITDQTIKNNYIRLFDNLSKNKFNSLSDIESAIDESYEENTVNRETMKYLNFLSGLSSYHTGTKDTHEIFSTLPGKRESRRNTLKRESGEQIANKIKADEDNGISHPNFEFYMFSDGWTIKPIITKMRSTKISGIESSSQDMSSILEELSVFLKYDVEPYMTKRIADFQIDYNKNFAIEDKNGANLRIARANLYKYLEGFNILDHKIGSDINKNILYSIVYAINDMTRRGDPSASPNKLDDKNKLISTDNILYNFKCLIENILENSNANENSYSDLYNYLSDNIKNINPEIKELVTNFDEMVKEYKADELYADILKKCSIEIKEADKGKPLPSVKNTEQNISDVNEYIIKAYEGSYNGSIKIRFNEKIGNNDVFSTNLYSYSMLSKINPELIELQRKAVTIESNLNRIIEQIKTSKRFDQEIGMEGTETISVCGQIEPYYKAQRELFETQRLMLQGYSNFFFSEQIYNVDNKYTHFIQESSLVFSKFSADVSKVYKEYVENYKEPKEPEDFSGILAPVIPTEKEEKEEEDDDDTTTSGTSQGQQQGPVLSPVQQQQTGQQTATPQAKSATTTKVNPKATQVEKEKEEQAKARLQESIKQDLANKLSNELRSSEAQDITESLGNLYGGVDSSDTSLFASALSALTEKLSTDVETDALEVLPRIKQKDDTESTTQGKPESSFEKCSRIHNLWRYKGTKIDADSSITKEEAAECSRISLTEKQATNIKSLIVEYISWFFTIIKGGIIGTCGLITTGAGLASLFFPISAAMLASLTASCAFIGGMLESQSCFPKLINFYIYNVLARYSANTNKEDVNTNNIVTKYAKIFLFHSVSQEEEEEKKKSVNQFGVKADQSKWCDDYIIPFFKSQTGNIKDQSFDLIVNDLKNSDFLKEKYKSVLNFRETDIYGHINEGAPIAFDESGILSIVDLFKELELENPIDKEAIEELKNKNIKEFECSDYNRLRSYKMVLLLGLNRPGNLLSYLSGKFFCKIFGMPNPSIGMIGGGIFYALVNTVKLIICNNKIRALQQICDIFFYPITKSLASYGYVDIVPKILGEIILISSEILKLPLARKYVLTELLGSQSKENSINIGRDIIEDHLKKIDEKIAQSAREGKILSFEEILSKEINSGLKNLGNDVIRELTSFLSSQVPEVKKEITNDLSSWVNGLNSNIYSLMGKSSEELTEFVFSFGEEIEDEFTTFIEENKTNPKKEALETTLENIKETLTLINRNNKVDKIPGVSEKYYEKLKKLVTEFDNNLNKDDPLYKQKNLIIPQIQEILDGLLKLNTSIKDRNLLIQQQFNKNNKSSSGLSGVIEKFSVYPIYTTDIDMWLSPCDDNQVLEKVTFDKISCIDIVTEEEEKEMLGKDAEFEKTYFDDRLKYFIKDFNNKIDSNNKIPLHDLVFAIYGLPDKYIDTNEKIFEYIKSALETLDKDLTENKDPEFTKEIKKFNKEKKLMLLETNYYGESNKNGKYENFLKIDKSTIIEQRAEKENEIKKKLSIIQENYIKKMNLTKTAEKEIIDKENKVIEAEINTIQAEIDILSAQIKSLKFSENDRKNQFFSSIKNENDEKLIFNMNDNKFYQNQNTLKSDNKLYLFYLFRNKYKKIFNSLPDVKLIHSCLKILSKEDSEFDKEYSEFDNLPENIRSEIITRDKAKSDEKPSKETIENLIISILLSNKETTEDVTSIIKNMFTNEDSKIQLEKYLRMIIVQKSEKKKYSVKFKKPESSQDQDKGKIIYGENGEIKNIVTPDDFFKIIYPSVFDKASVPEEGETKYYDERTEFFNAISKIQNLGYDLSTKIEKGNDKLQFKVEPLTPYILGNTGDDLKKIKIQTFEKEIEKSEKTFTETKTDLYSRIIILDTKRINDMADAKFKESLKDPITNAAKLVKFLDENTEDKINKFHDPLIAASKQIIANAQKRKTEINTELTAKKKKITENAEKRKTEINTELTAKTTKINTELTAKTTEINRKYQEINNQITGTSKIITNLVPVPDYIKEYNRKIDEINNEIQKLKEKADKKNDASACSDVSIAKAIADNKNRYFFSRNDYVLNQQADCKAAEDDLKAKNDCEYKKDEKNTPLSCKTENGILFSSVTENNKHIIARDIAISENTKAKEAEQKNASDYAAEQQKQAPKDAAAQQKIASDHAAAEQKIAFDNAEIDKAVQDKIIEAQTFPGSLFSSKGELVLKQEAKAAALAERIEKERELENVMNPFKAPLLRAQKNYSFSELIKACKNAKSPYTTDSPYKTDLPYKEEAEQIERDFATAEQTNNDNKNKLRIKILKVDPNYENRGKIENAKNWIGNFVANAAIGVANVALGAKHNIGQWLEGVNIFAQTDYIFPKEITVPTFLFLDESNWFSNPLNMDDLTQYRTEKELALAEKRDFTVSPLYEFIEKYYEQKKTDEADDKTLFLFKPDIELYKYEFSDFVLDDFVDKVIDNYKGVDKYLNYFHERKIVGPSSSVTQNEENHNFLLKQLPFNIFSSKNVYLYWNLHATDENKEPIIKNYISLTDLENSKEVSTEFMLGNINYNIKK
jgi:hypothetical protein